MEPQNPPTDNGPFFEPACLEQEGILAVQEKLSSTPFNLRAAVLFSFLLHLFIVGSLMIGAYRQDKRPVKEVAYWVVDLVPLANAEPRSTEKALSKTSILEGYIKVASPKSEKDFIGAETTHRLEPVESSSVTQEAKAEPAVIVQTPPPPPVFQSWENSLKVLQDSLSNQVQAGQYRLVMKMPDQMMAVKFNHFQKSMREQVVALLKSSLLDESIDRLIERKAAVEILYSEDGRLEKVSFSEDSDPDLASLLQEKINWDPLPPPQRYSFPSKAMRLRIGINEQGKIFVGVELL